MDTVLIAHERKERAKKVRRQGWVPGNIYGPGINRNVNIKFEENKINRFLKTHYVGSKTVVNINEKDCPCVIKDIQYEPIIRKPIHIDLYATSEDKRIKVNVPIKFKGKEQLALNNLVLQVLEDEIRLQGALKNLPEFVTVDVAALADGDIVTADKLPLPENVRLLVKPDKVIARITRAVKAPQQEETDAEE